MAAPAFDRRRVNGPEVSFPPVYDDELPLPAAASSSSTTAAAAFDSLADAARRYKRTTRAKDDLRPIFLKTGLINQANGSAYIEMENTKIACAIYGPRPRPPPYAAEGTLNVEVKYAPFASDPRRFPLRDTEPPLPASLLAQSLIPALRLHLLPKSQLDVFLLVLESDGVEGVVAAGTTAAGAALAGVGGGVEMMGLVVGVGSAKIDGQLFLDPTARESQLATSRLTIACLPSLGVVTNVWSTGQAPVDAVMTDMETLMERAKDVHAVVARAIIEGVEEREAKDAREAKALSGAA